MIFTDIPNWFFQIAAWQSWIYILPECYPACRYLSFDLKSKGREQVVVKFYANRRIIAPHD